MSRRRSRYTETPVEPLPTARTKTPARIFSVGQILPSGKVADAAFLDHVVNNWQQHQAKGDPTFPRPPAYLIPAPAVGIGHEDDQALARSYSKRSDLPAVGWPEDVRREGNFLVAHFTGVPHGLARWIESGAYRHCSSEFYEDYQGLGPTLRRVSLLGADIPACKDLGQLPQLIIDEEQTKLPNPLAFTERLAAFAKRHRKGFAASFGGARFVQFNESPTMNANQLAIAAILQQAGLDTSTLTPEAVDGILSGCAGLGGGGPAPAAAAAAEPTQDVQPVTPKPAAAAEPEPPVVPAKPAAAAEPDPAKQPAAAFSEIMRGLVLASVTPLQNQVATMQAELKQATAKLASADRVSAHAAVAAFCELHKDKIYPYELDASIPGNVTLIAQALEMSDSPVATFAEGKLSQRAAFLASIAKRPPVAKFVERMRAPATGDAQRDRVNSLLSATDIGRAALKAQTAAAVPQPRIAA